ncbi:uncharacterized protein PG986_010175 [Apiospora aurea]|uniref:Uncharacterized protein n=1 Tax=Apiospora aurea TaxID=335848 RepID=A0ABR1QA61_9PEZI
MSSGKYHQSATLSQVKREKSDRKIKREDMDRDIKQEMTDSPYRSIVKDEDDDEKKPLAENQPIKKRARAHQPNSRHEYSWAAETSDAKAKSRILGIIEIPTDQVGRVMEGGKLTGAYHLNYSHPIKTFVVYDGLEVLARVQDFEMETAVYQLAALYFGAKLGWSHPDEQDLDVSSIPMKGEGAFVVKVSLMAKEEPKKRKGPSRR